MVYTCTYTNIHTHTYVDNNNFLTKRKTRRKSLGKALTKCRAHESKTLFVTLVKCHVPLFFCWHFHRLQTSHCWSLSLEPSYGKKPHCWSLAQKKMKNASSLDLPQWNRQENGFVLNLLPRAGVACYLAWDGRRHQVWPPHPEIKWLPQADLHKAAHHPILIYWRESM